MKTKKIYSKGKLNAIWIFIICKATKIY